MPRSNSDELARADAQLKEVLYRCSDAVERQDFGELPELLRELRHLQEELREDPEVRTEGLRM